MPVDHDAAITAHIMRAAGVRCVICPNLAALCAAVDEQAGALLIADSALAGQDLAPLAARIAQQPPWSDLPVVVLTDSGAAARAQLAAQYGAALGNVTVWQRSPDPFTMPGAALAALRARSRQRQIGNEMSERTEAARRATQELERAVAGRTAQLSQTLEQLRGEVTERQRVEAALRQAQKMEAIGQLTGGIAHDFNNMLQAIAGNLECVPLLLEQGLLGEATRFVDAASRTVDRAAVLARRLLAFGRRQELKPAPIPPGVLLQDLEDLMRRAMGPGVEIVLDLAPGLWTVHCDPSQLENILLNLAINARDAMPDGGRLTITVANAGLTAADFAGQDACPPGDYVQIAFADTGTGMTPDVLERAFEPFFTTKPAGQGTGLGLSQIHGFVRQSNGAVRLESTRGVGTTVRLFLPRGQGDAVPEPPAIEEAAPGSAAGTVLVVEDELSIRMLVAATIRRLGCRVLEASDGLAALRLLQSRERIDLLVTDVGLPGLDGRQLAEAGRALRPDLSVLITTGYIGAHMEDWPLAPGVEVIGKPFKLNTLRARISKMLDQGAKVPAL